MEGYFVGTVLGFAFDYNPGGSWVTCDGRALSVNDYFELYSLIYETYGGDGITFNVPDLRERVPVGYGDSFAMGSKGGAEQVLLTLQNIPEHMHPPVQVNIPVSSNTGDLQSPADGYLAKNTDGTTNAFGTATSQSDLVNMASVKQTSSAIGASNPDSINVRGASLSINYCICVKGIFPSKP